MDRQKVSPVLAVLSFTILFAGTLWTVGTNFCQPVMAAPAKKQQSQPAKPAPGPNYSAAYGAYLNRIRTRLSSNWNLPDGRNRVVITALIQTDGSTTDVNVSSTPKNAKAEEAANEAFTKAQPFEALPSGTAPTAKIIFTFDSTSTQHDSSSGINMRMDPIIAQPAAGQ